VRKGKKKDAFFLIEGIEGEGKTTLSIALAYYASEKINRPFSEKHVFFDLYKMIEFGKETESQIIIWDEPALAALATDSRSALVADLTRFLIMARKKRHLIIVNVAHFNKFNDYIIADRPVGMIKVYTRKRTEEPRFIYIPNTDRKNLRKLWDDWRKNRKKNYFKYASKQCRGTWPDILNPDYKYNVLSEFDLDSYERNKDDAIGQIGSKKKTKTEMKLLKLQYNVSQFPKHFKKITNVAIAELCGVSQSTLTAWREIKDKYPNFLKE
jgi:hypothetical protein